MTTEQLSQAVVAENLPATKTPAKKAGTKPLKTAAPVAAKSDAKPAKKQVAKASAQPAPQASAKPLATRGKAIKAKQAAVPQPKHDKPAKAKKPKLVRDSFTIPKSEYLILDELKLRATKLVSPVKKTELIRAGIKALAAMTDTAFLAAVKAVTVIKTGRPSLN